MKRFLQALAALFALTCPQAVAATLKATPATLHGVVKGSAPGDVVQLGGGDYPGLSTYKFVKAAPGVILEPAPGASVVLRGLWLNQSAGFTVRGLEITPHPAKGDAVIIQGSQRIVLERLKVHGDPATYRGIGGAAASIRGSSQVSLTDSDLGFMHVGVVHLDNEHLEIARNRIHDIALDGMRGTGNFLRIVDNRFWNFFPKPGDHNDAIQFWTVRRTRANTDILIEDNTIEQGDGDFPQGIFLGNERGLPYERVTIRRNSLVGVNYHGISLYNARASRIEDNFVQGVIGNRDGKGAQVRPWVKVFDSPAGEVVTAKNVIAAVAKRGDFRARDTWLRRNKNPRIAAFGAKPAEPTALLGQETALRHEEPGVAAILAVTTEFGSR